MSKPELRLQHFESLISSAEQMLSDGLLTDITIQCEDEKFPAHGFLLAASSCFFKEVFSDESFSDKKKVNLEGIKPQIFNIVLKFFYTGTVSIDEEDLSLILDVLECAVVLQVSTLYTFCLKLLLLRPSLDHILSLWEKLKEFGNDKICSIYLTFMNENLDSLQGKPSFLEVSFDDLLNLLQILNEAETEQQKILDCFLIWIKHDFDSRQEYILDLSKYVSFKKIPKNSLRHMLESEICVRKCASLAMLIIDALQDKVQEKEKQKNLSAPSELLNFGDVDCESATSGSENLEIFESTPKSRSKKPRKNICASLSVREVVAKKRKLEPRSSQCNVVEHRAPEKIIRINDLSVITDSKKPISSSQKITESVDDLHEIRKIVEQTPSVLVRKDDSLHLAPKKISRSAHLLTECAVTNNDNDISLSSTVNEDDCEILETRSQESSTKSNSLFVKEQIICMFGIDKGGTFSPLQMYLKCLQKTWIKKTDYPDEFMHYNSVCSYDNMLYFCGGRSTTDKLPTNSCWRYDLTSDKWERMHPMITRRCYAAVVELKEILYVLGGFSDKEPLKLVECYNPAHDTWQALAPLPYPIANPVVVTVINRLCIIDKMRLLWYNPSRNSWTSGISLHEDILNIQTRAAASYDQLFVIPHYRPHHVYQIAVNGKVWKKWDIPNDILMDCWAIMKNVNIDNWEFSVLSSKGIFLYNPPCNWELFDDTTHDLYYVRAAILNLLQLRQQT